MTTMNELMNDFMMTVLDQIITEAIENGDTNTLKLVKDEYGEFIGEENTEFLQALIAA